MRPTVCRVLFGYRIQEKEVDLIVEVYPKAVNVRNRIDTHD